MSWLQMAFGSCVLSIGLIASGCGADGREFTASELVEELNANGAPFQLEGPLLNDQENVEVYELSVSTASSPTAGGQVESGATLTIAETDEQAITEFQRCESSVSLTCFRVANGVLLLSDDEPGLLAEVEAAVRAMESE